MSANKSRIVYPIRYISVSPRSTSKLSSTSNFGNLSSALAVKDWKSNILELLNSVISSRSINSSCRDSYDWEI